MKLLIRNLNRLTTEEELIDLFKEFGTVQFCKLVFDRDTGESKGFGFIEMPKAGEAKSAVMHLNKQTLRGNEIRVKKADDKKTADTKKREDKNEKPEPEE